ncbi:MAG TPA: hypothetical protein VGG33_21605, partial [Polyangia bacterium]
MKNRLPWAVGMLLLGAVALTSGCDDDDNPPPADAGADLGGTGGTGGTPGTDASPDRGMDTPVSDVPMGDVPVGGDTGTPDTQPPTAMKATLGPAGGTITFHGGRLTLIFPRGALVRPTEIEVSVAASPPAGGLGT